MIEMRDAQAFKVKLGINDKVFGKIGFEKLVVFRFENVQRQRVAAFLEGVDDFFELSKHGLPEQRAAQIIDLAVDDISPHFRITRDLEQMMREQFLVER